MFCVNASGVAVGCGVRVGAESTSVETISRPGISMAAPPFESLAGSGVSDGLSVWDGVGLTLTGVLWVAQPDIRNKRKANKESRNKLILFFFIACNPVSKPCNLVLAHPTHHPS